MKRIIIISLFLLVPLSGLFAQAQPVKRSEIIENLRGLPYYIHFVGAGETLEAIAAAYEIEAEVILKANPEIADGLKVNHVLKIPFKSSGVSNVAGVEAVPAKEVKEIKQTEPVKGKVHSIEPKETWYGIARLYQVPVKDLIAANPGIDTLRIGMKLNIPENLQQQQTVNKPGYLQHTVQPQETLYSLSNKYDVTIDELTSCNPELADGLKTGQVLNIPLKQVREPESEPQQKQEMPGQEKYREHVVVGGESLYGIAKSYGVEISDILKANPGLNGELKKNDVIRIPYPGPVQQSNTPQPSQITKEIKEEGPVTAEEKSTPRPCGVGNSKDQQYTVALLIPFMLEEADSIATGDPTTLRYPTEYHSLDFVQFYEGSLLAIDSLSRAGLKVKVLVFDADAGENVSKTRRILAKAEMADVDLIIGPFFARSFELVAEFAARHSIPVVNPLSQREEILAANPYVFKIQPSAWSQYNETARYIANNFSGSNVLIIRRNKDENSNMATTLATAVEKHSAGQIKVREIIYAQSFDAGLFNNLVAGKKNVIMVLTSDKALLPALLRKMNDVRGKYDITIFGLPEWEELELDSQYLLNLKTHLFNAWFVNYSDPAVKSFVSIFTERYKTEPIQSEHAFLGYDISFYFLNNLFTYGRGFSKCLSSIDHQGLSTGFTFWKTETGGYENAASSVYELKDYKRRLVNR